MSTTPSIAGYVHGGELSPSPVTPTDLDLLLTTLLWSEDDTAAIRRAGEVLDPQVEDVLDVWYGFVGGNDHLVRYFNDTSGEPAADYLAGVRARFGQWIRDLCQRDWDASWLAQQEEIALRHNGRMGQADGVDTQHSVIPLRYLVAFVVPITITIRPFLEQSGATPADVQSMHDAWFKAVALTVVLWSRPHAGDDW